MTIRQWLVRLFGDKFAKQVSKVIPLPDIKPVPATPEKVACGCDFAKPLATPLVPKLGNSDGAVDLTLRQRWQNGADDGCGGTPGALRPLALRKLSDGRFQTFGWKYALSEADKDTGIRVVINGDKMTIYCGVYAQQRWHVIGCSDMECPSNGSHPSTLPDWVVITPGVEGPKKMFVYFEVRDL